MIKLTRFLPITKKRVIRYVLIPTAVLVVGLTALSFYVDYELANRSHRAYDDCRKVWSARGIYGGTVAQNSIESVAVAFDEGAMGVEVDIYFDRDMRDFVVSHDEPYQLKNGELLMLGDLLAAYPEPRYYWLDFKKLRRLTNKQAHAAVARLLEITQPYGLESYVYVEGENPTNLSLFHRAGFHTIFDTHPLADDSVLTPAILACYRMIYYFGDHTVLGMPYGTMDKPVYGPRTERKMADVPVFLYHVPSDEGLVDELMLKDNVRVTLIGRDECVNFHDKNHCNP